MSKSSNWGNWTQLLQFCCCSAGESVFICPQDLGGWILEELTRLRSFLLVNEKLVQPGGCQTHQPGISTLSCADEPPEA